MNQFREIGQGRSSAESCIGHLQRPYIIGLGQSGDIRLNGFFDFSLGAEVVNTFSAVALSSCPAPSTLPPKGIRPPIFWNRHAVLVTMAKFKSRLCLSADPRHSGSQNLRMVGTASTIQAPQRVPRVPASSLTDFVLLALRKRMTRTLANSLYRIRRDACCSRRRSRDLSCGHFTHS